MCINDTLEYRFNQISDADIMAFRSLRGAILRFVVYGLGCGIMILCQP
jgi:hypothetical protein